MTQVTIDRDGGRRTDGAGARRRALAATIWRVGFTVCVVLAGLVTCFVESSPAGNFIVMMVLFGVWLLLGFVWLAWVVVEAVIALAARSRTQSSPRGRRWRWPVASALVVVVTIGFVVTYAPLKVRFGLSESRLSAFVEGPGAAVAEYAPDEVVPETARCIALYCFEKVERVGDDLFLTVGSAGLAFDEAGFAYSAVGDPDEGDLAAGYRYEYEQLGDGWYSFYAFE